MGLPDHGLETLEPRRLLATFAISDYFPLRSGDQWAYAGSVNGLATTAVATLAPGATLEGIATSRLTTVFTPNNGSASTTDRRFYAHTTTGLRLLRENVDEPAIGSNVLFGAGARLVPPTISDGAVVHVVKSLSGTTSEGRSFTGTFTGDVTIVGLENIHVGAGSFEALRINLTGTLAENGSTGWTGAGAISESLWLVRGVGAVRADYASMITYSDGGEHAFRYNLGLTSAPRLNGVQDTTVRGKGVVVAYGDSSPTTVDGTNYGGIDVNGQLKTRVFTIENTTDHAISLAPGNQGFITIQGANAGEFTVVRQPVQTLQPGQVGIFSVRFDPAALGFRYATVSFRTTEQNAQPFSFDIRGTGILVGDINVLGPQSQAIDSGDAASTGNGTVFGSAVAAGTQRIQRIFTISNTGLGSLVLTAPLRVVITGDAAADFAVTLLPAASIGTGQSSVFKISFDPGAVGARNAQVTIYSNDWHTPAFTFGIAGTGA